MDLYLVKEEIIKMKDYNFFSRNDDFKMNDSYHSVRDYSNLDYSNLGNKNRLYPVTKSISGNLSYD